MATWEQLRDYIHTRYKATDISPRAIEMLFSTPGGRSQAVWVSFAEGPNGEHWAQIDSAIGPLGGVDLVSALKLVENAVCGGLCHLLVRGQSLVSLRHSVPLDHLDGEEFDSPLLMVAAAADDFEQQLMGRDAV